MVKIDQKELFKEIDCMVNDIYFEVDGNTLKFTIQDGPIGEVGENGCQIDTLGIVWLEILRTFNRFFPCRENSITITKIQEALMWQEQRTKNREKRGVEGFNRA